MSVPRDWRLFHPSVAGKGGKASTRGALGVSVVRVGPDDWAIWRDLRLTALRQSPSAFGSSYEDNRVKTEMQWRDRLDPVHGLAAIATVDDQAIGMVGAYSPAPDVVELISMWVSPAARGRGVGDAFARTGDMQPLPSDPCKDEIAMRRLP